MTSSQPNPAPEIYADVGRMQGYRFCSETLIDLIQNKETLATIKNRLIEVKCDTVERRRSFFEDKVNNEGWTKDEVSKSVSGEKDAIQTIIDLIRD